MAKVDEADYGWLSSYRWWVTFSGGQPYAYTQVEVNGKRTSVMMSRMILKLTDKAKEAEHEDHDTLNNVRSNLRVASRSQNVANTRKRKGSSQYKGVAWHRQSGKWQATITHNRKQIALGTYNSEREAAAAYDVKSKALFGEFALTNGIA